MAGALENRSAALRVKRVVVEIFSKIESGLAEGSIPKPPIVEGFSFLEKVASLAENVFQFDFLNLNAAIELDPGRGQRLHSGRKACSEVAVILNEV